MNSPSPTGEPQLNQEPQARQWLQCACDSSRHCSYSFLSCSMRFSSRSTMVISLLVIDQPILDDTASLFMPSTNGQTARRIYSNLLYIFLGSVYYTVPKRLY